MVFRELWEILCFISAGKSNQNQKENREEGASQSRCVCYDVSREVE